MIEKGRKIKKIIIFVTVIVFFVVSPWILEIDVNVRNGFIGIHFEYKCIFSFMEKGLNLMISNPSFEDGTNPCFWWGKVLFEDHFEEGDFNKWDVSTNWDLTKSQSKSSSHAAHVTGVISGKFYENFDNNCSGRQYCEQDCFIPQGWVVNGNLYGGAGCNNYSSLSPTPPSIPYWCYFQVNKSYDSEIYVDTGIAVEDGETYILEYYTGQNTGGGARWTSAIMSAELYAGNPNNGGTMLGSGVAEIPDEGMCTFNSHIFSTGTGNSGDLYIRFYVSTTESVFEQPLLDNVNLRLKSKFYENFDSNCSCRHFCEQDCFIPQGWVVNGNLYGGAGCNNYSSLSPTPPSLPYWCYFQVNKSYDSEIYVDTGIAVEDGETYILEYYTGQNTGGGARWTSAIMSAELYSGNPNNGGTMLGAGVAEIPDEGMSTFNSHIFYTGTGNSGNLYVRFYVSATESVFEQPLLDNVNLRLNGSELISHSLDINGVDAIRISFWYRDNDIDDDDNVRLQLYDGLNYDDIILTYPKVTLTFDLGNTEPEDDWHLCRMDLYNEGDQAQYFHSNFRIRFKSSGIDSGENLWIDDVKIEASTDITDIDANNGIYSVRLDEEGEYCQYKGAGSWIVGKKYEVSVWAKASGMSGGRVDLIFDDQVKYSIDSNTDGWEFFTFEHIASSDRGFSENVKAEYYNNGGTVFLDNWAIREIHDDVSPTRYHGLSSDDNELHNPERGFRYEIIYPNPYTGETDPNTNWKEKSPPGMSLALVYENLSGFTDTDLSEEKLDYIRDTLDNLRNYGMKCLLRFAYLWSFSDSNDPTSEQILRHIEQLEPIINEANDVIYVWQAGFLRPYGEWYDPSNIYSWQEKAEIVNAILNVAEPINRKVILRTPSYKEEILKRLDGCFVVDSTNVDTNEPCAMIGYHNDGFMANITDGGTFTEGPYYANPGNKEFDYMTLESRFVPVDGELYVPSPQDWDCNIVDGIKAAERMRLHHYSSFSVDHSWDCTFTKWKQEYISANELRKLKMPFSDSYFKNSVGEEVERTIYEYIRDHLGYRIELQWGIFPNAIFISDTLSVEVSLINRGFAAPINPRPVYFLLIDSNNTVYEIETDADPRKWQPFEPGIVGVQLDEEFLPLLHKISIETSLPDEISPGIYKLGLWLPDASNSLRYKHKYAVRVANRDVTWDRGVNILGKIVIIPDEIYFYLSSGLNLFVYPDKIPQNYTSYDLIVALGTKNEVIKIQRYSPNIKTFETTTYDLNGLPIGDKFNIVNGEGYLVYMKTNKTIQFLDLIINPGISCKTGLNIVSIPGSLLGYTSYDLLLYLGTPEEITSIQKFNRKKGILVPNYYFFGRPCGVRFNFDYSKAYIIYLNEEKSIPLPQ